MHLELQYSEEGLCGRKDPIRLRRKDSGSLQGRNQPIPIRDEHELAHLFLGEFYKKQKSCSISNLDIGAILRILLSASCFPEDVKVQAEKVEDKVRGPWNRAVFENWTKQRTGAAFSELEHLAQLLPNHQTTLSQLREDSTRRGGFDFPEQAFLKAVNKYRGSIRSLQSKVKKITHLKRRFRDLSTGHESTNIEELVVKEETVFLRGSSGSGKGTETSRLLTEWADGNLMKSVVFCFKISAASTDETSLNQMFWNQPEPTASQSFDHFKKLAFEGKLAILIDRVDNLGTMTKDDLKEVARATSQPDLQISLRAVCLGILTKKLLPGAKLLATVRSFCVPNEILTISSTTTMYDIEDLNNEDISILVRMIEEDQEKQKIIEDKLYKIANLGNHHLLKTPMLATGLIKLIQERKVDDKISIFEVYLTLLTRNLSIYTEDAKLTGEPTDDQIHFLRFLKLLQMQVVDSSAFPWKTLDFILLQVQSSNEDMALQGTILSVENVGKCFEVGKYRETLQIPVEFIKKLRIFEFTLDGDRASVQSSHKSFLQFSCALSLCLNGGDLQHELSEIKERSSYIAIVLHMASLFSAMANSCTMLNTLKQLCGQNGDQERRRSLHAIFESITSRGSRVFAQEGIEVHITLTSGEKIKTNSKVTNLLVEVMRASGEKVSLTLKRVILPRVNEDEWNEIESVLNFIELLQTKPEEEKLEVFNKSDDFQFTSLKFATDSDYIRLSAFFGAIQGWTLDFLDLDVKKKEV